MTFNAFLAQKVEGYELLGIDMDIWAYWIAGFLTVFANLISTFSIYSHWSFPHTEANKRHIIRILLMINIYALESWLSLIWVDANMYLACIRDCWEAVVIYEFYMLIVSCVGGYQAIRDDMHGVTQQMWPMNYCVKAWEVNALIFWTRSGILQYSVCQVFCSMIIFISEVLGIYHEGVWKWSAVYPYMCFIISASQSWAIYCLV